MGPYVGAIKRERKIVINSEGALEPTLFREPDQCRKEEEKMMTSEGEENTDRKSFWRPLLNSPNVKRRR